MTADHPTREEQYAAVIERLIGVARRQALTGDGPRAEGFVAGLDLALECLADAAALVAADPAPEAQRANHFQYLYQQASEAYIADLRARLSHVEAERDAARVAQPDAALSDEERELLGDWWDSDWPADAPHVLVTLYATVERILAARAAQPVPAPEVSRGVAKVNIIQRIVNAWDCCATCAGGVLAQHDREVKAEALREAADDWPREVNAETIRREIATFDLRDIPEEYRVDQWLRDRADRLVRDALGGERGDGA